MPRPIGTDPDPAATPSRLLGAAEVEFARRGFDGARLEDVAERAGIRRPSLLYHFPSKAALYEAVVERVFAELGAVLTAAMATSGGFRQRFEGVVGAFAGFLDRTPRFASLVLRELMDDRGHGRELLRRNLVPLLDRVEAFVEEEGTGCVGPRVPARAALLAVASEAVLHAAAGPLRGPVWREPHDPVALARALLFSPSAET